MFAENEQNLAVLSQEKEEEEILSQSTNHSNENMQNELNFVQLEQISFQILEKIDQIITKVRIVYENADSYEGEVDPRGLKDGWGIYLYNNNEKYEGFWQNNQIHGYGKYYFQGGEHYEGDFYEGRKDGVGILKLSQGDRYEGEFYRDEFDGRGKYFYANGDKFEGIWKEGKKNGDGSFLGKERKIIGEWIDDELQHF